MQPKEFKGYNGVLILDDRGVTIKRGAKGFLLGGGMLRGDKTIPFRSITAVQFKKAGMTVGYIQFSVQGGREAKGGVMQSVQDENTITFQRKHQASFEEAKGMIEQRMEDALSSATSSNLDELKKLGELLENGVITKDEFEQKKESLLNL